MKILFLTDSLSLPREENGQVVKYEETYLSILRKEFPEMLIVDSAIGGATIWDLFRQIFYYKYFEPDLVIIQCGIVDCAPRAFTEFEKKILNRLGIRAKGLTSFLRRYRGLKRTSRVKFEKTAIKIKNEFSNIPVYAIGILPASLEYEKKVPGIENSIAIYNQILKGHFHFIESCGFPMEGILNDHHHLNKYGHEVIADNIRSVLIKIKDSR